MGGPAGSEGAGGARRKPWCDYTPRPLCLLRGVLGSGLPGWMSAFRNHGPSVGGMASEKTGYGVSLLIWRGEYSLIMKTNHWRLGGHRNNNLGIAVPNPACLVHVIHGPGIRDIFCPVRYDRLVAISGHFTWHVWSVLHTPASGNDVNAVHERPEVSAYDQIRSYIFHSRSSELPLLSIGPEILRDLPPP